MEVPGLSECLDYEQPLFSSLIHRARKKKTLASEKWPGENWERDERAGKFNYLSTLKVSLYSGLSK